MLDGPVKSRLFSAAGYVAWLVTLVWLIATGNYTSFLAPNLWVLLAAAAALLGVLVVATATGRSADGTRAADNRFKWATLLLPLVFLALVPCGDAGSYAFDQRSGGRMGPGGQSLAAYNCPTSRPDVLFPNAPPQQVTLSELYSRHVDLAGRRVVVQGMINPRKDLPEGTALLFRFTIACCAADAQPVAVILHGEGDLSKLRRDTWVEIEGVVGRDVLADSAVPAVWVESVRKIRRPLQPYLN